MALCAVCGRWSRRSVKGDRSAGRSCDATLQRSESSHMYWSDRNWCYNQRWEIIRLFVGVCIYLSSEICIAVQLNSPRVGLPLSEYILHRASPNFQHRRARLSISLSSASCAGRGTTPDFTISSRLHLLVEVSFVQVLLPCFHQNGLNTSCIACLSP